MIFSSLEFEQALWQQGYQFVCGVDEVGRGCFAGPLVTAAVIFPQNVQLPQGLADSKLLKAKQRLQFAEQIKQLALAWQIEEIPVELINQLGVGKAAEQGFARSVQQLSQQPDFVLVDAFKIPDWPADKQRAIIKGDQLSSSIAAAAIIAKVYRDQLMEKLATQFPGYGFEQHKGYGTKQHQQAIKSQGLCPLHRRSFNLIKFL